MSRSRSSTTATDAHIALDEAALPVELPDVPDYSPVLFDPDDADSEPSPPLAKATDWVHVELDLGDGLKPYTPRHQRDAAVGRQLLVRAALHRSAQLGTVLRQGKRGLLDGPAARRARPARSRRRRPVRRRRRARGAAPAVLRGSGTRSSTTWATSAPASRTAGWSTRATSRRSPTPMPAGLTCRPTRWSSATAGSSIRDPTARSRSSRNSAKSVRA